MTDSEMRPEADRRVRVDRRSGADTRSEDQKRLTDERRSQIFRRSSRASEQPSKDQLSLFAKRVRRAMRDEKSHHFSVLLREKVILPAMPTSFDHLNG